MNRFIESIFSSVSSVCFGTVYVGTGIDLFGFLALLTLAFGAVMFIEGVFVHWIMKRD